MGCRKDGGGRKMSWKRIKNLALVILLVLDLYFGASVIKQYNDVNYYSAEEREMVEDILLGGNIYVPEGLLSIKKPKLAVYSRRMSQAELIKLVGHIYGSENVDAYPYGCTARVRGGTLNVGYDGKLGFFTDGADYPSLILSKPGTAEVEPTEADKKYCNEIIESLLCVSKVSSSGSNRGAQKSRVAFEKLFYSAEKDVYVIEARQYLGNVAASDKIWLAMRGGNVISAEGVFVYLLPNRRYEADCTDIVDVLFSEKRNADMTYGEGQYPFRAIESINYSYEVFYDDEDVSYYVPTCNLVYSGGETHSYNLVDGERVK